jgi:hypothetical protein
VPNAVYFYQAAYSVSGTSPAIISTRLEDVNTLAGQTATFSFYAKVNTGTQSITPRYVQDFGSGGSATVVTNMTAQTLTTSWQRFTITSTIPSVSGKTIGTSSYLRIDLLAATSGTLTYQVANIQLEASNTATAFQTATGTLQGELAACQRYYFRTQTGTNAGYFGVTVAGSATTTYANVIMKQTMRTSPTSIDFSGLRWQAITSSGNITNATISDATPENVILNCTTTGATAAVMNYFSGQSNTAYVGFSAEL